MAADFTFAIGDIHGRADLLERLLEAARARGTFDLVTLGDYVDRGPSVPAVIDILMGDIAGCASRIVLKGNHEDMMLRTMSGDFSYSGIWLGNGGRETLEGYGVDPNAVEEATEASEGRGDRIEELREQLPDRHWQFLNALPLRHEDEAHIYVHAGLDPRRPQDDQPEEALLWIRDAFLNSRRDFGKLVVHGHTVDMSGPHLTPNRLNLDTGAVWSGTLSGAIIAPDRQEPVLILTTDPTRPTVPVDALRAGMQ